MWEIRPSLMTAFVLAMSLPLITIAFSPVSPSRQSSRKSSTGVNMMIPQNVVVMAPANTATPSLTPSQEASFSALISTMYVHKTDSIKPLESPGSALGARGGAAAPAVTATEADKQESSKAREALLKMEANGSVVLDPSVISQYDQAMPGFKVTRGVLPVDTQAARMNGEGETVRTFAEDVLVTSFMTHVMSRLPVVTILAVIVDFFFIQPGIEVYREDLEENEMEVIQAGVKGNLVRVGVLAVLAATTLFATDKFG